MVAVAWLLGEKDASTVEPALLRLESDEALVPRLSHLEVRNSLLVVSRRGRLTPDAPTERLDALRELPVHTGSGLDLSLTFVSAQQHGLSFYDAVHVGISQAAQCADCNARQGTHGIGDPEILRRAARMLADGTSLRRTARELDLCRATLRT
ncbi:MAG: type II toxin-antitoxin system VapC family toxin [Bryobacterales bacterium]|nr:type II toxin-antitoxin system VapC family toxin [Bryobacterales bacterium]